jgi:murein DD-endopeptidase MepM/ murein hydrolase activator NlpD
MQVPKWGIDCTNEVNSSDGRWERECGGALRHPLDRHILSMSMFATLLTLATVRIGTVSAQAFIWPVSTVDRSRGQDYAQRNLFGDNKHHTGMDLAGTEGIDDIISAADGWLVMIQENDVGCAPPPVVGGCFDHGFGNTVIVQHTIGGQIVYTQYSHLYSIVTDFNDACPLTSNARHRRICPKPGEAGAVPVLARRVLGKLGRSRYGMVSDQTFNPHLHFEVKKCMQLGTTGNDGPEGKCPDGNYTTIEYGYTTQFPGSWGYYDPVLYLHQSSSVATLVEVTPSGQDVGLRIGPNSAYRLLRGVDTGERFYAFNTADPVTSTSCSNPAGWYQIRPKDGSYFADNTPGYAGTSIPDGWACAGSGDTRYFVEVAPSVLPDLTISAIVSGRVPETNVAIPVTVFRTEGSLTQGSYVTAGLYWSKDAKWDTSDQQLWASNNGSSPDYPNDVLNLNGSRTVIPSVDIPNRSGGCYIIALVDIPANFHAEASEANNITPYRAFKRADLNIDCTVNVVDLGILLSNWNRTTKPLADINQDGVVNVIDLGILLSNWSF